ncbi:MAG: ribosomal protein S18-alanine N-acetyltransferase [Nitrospirae bacterium]|nr:ribosomal protein S18-alanine N-acetyltransferase [Nitrospirota bacterium]
MTGESVLITAMGFRHLEEARRIERSSCLNPWSMESFESELSCAHSLPWVAVSADGRVIGFIICRRVEDGGEVLKLAVSPSMRRRGIGGKLLRHAMGELKKLGVVRVSLEVRESNAAAIGLYERFGFKRLAARKEYYRNPVENAAVMFADL